MTIDHQNPAFRRALEELVYHYGAGGCLERHRFLFKTLVTGGYVDLSRKQRQDVVGYCEALEEVLEKLSKALAN